MPEQRQAVIDGEYRYALERWWGSVGPAALFIMCNPSTADDTVDDATIRRCRGFAMSWGMAGLYVVNLYAYRATAPLRLLDAADPVGPRNAAFLRSAISAQRVGRIVAAWGATPRRLAESGKLPDMTRAVVAQASNARRLIRCLGTTKEGDPRHPLYVRADAGLTGWEPIYPAAALGRIL